jgi:hypothetical protein
LTVISENTDPSLVTQGWFGDKPCLVTVDTRAYVTMARPDVLPDGPKGRRTKVSCCKHSPGKPYTS